MKSVDVSIILSIYKANKSSGLIKHLFYSVLLKLCDQPKMIHRSIYCKESPRSYPNMSAEVTLPNFYIMRMFKILIELM